MLEINQIYLSSRSIPTKLTQQKNAGFDLKLKTCTSNTKTKKYQR